MFAYQKKSLKFEDDFRSLVVLQQPQHADLVELMLEGLHVFLTAGILAAACIDLDMPCKVLPISRLTADEIDSTGVCAIGYDLDDAIG